MMLPAVHQSRLKRVLDRKECRGLRCPQSRSRRGRVNYHGRRSPRQITVHLLRNLVRTAPSLQRTAVTVRISGLAYGAPQLDECLIDITGASGALDHSLGALPQQVEGGFALGSCVYREQSADQATDV